MVVAIHGYTEIQYLGDRTPGRRLVHDLTHAKVRCQVAEVICSGAGVRFEPDTLAEAHREGFDDCDWCIREPAR